ncbi:hypothetical protein C8R43DRAFT_960440 [Mycena crocata]|nr:hypothetical protein C8R43DRAFT_960440 [Mycena crocata]
MAGGKRMSLRAPDKSLALKRIQSFMVEEPQQRQRRGGKRSGKNGIDREPTDETAWRKFGGRPSVSDLSFVNNDQPRPATTFLTAVHLYSTHRALKRPHHAVDPWSLYRKLLVAFKFGAEIKWESLPDSSEDSERVVVKSLEKESILGAPLLKRAQPPAQMSEERKLHSRTYFAFQPFCQIQRNPQHAHPRPHLFGALRRCPFLFMKLRELYDVHSHVSRWYHGPPDQFRVAPHGHPSPFGEPPLYRPGLSNKATSTGAIRTQLDTYGLVLASLWQAILAVGIRQLVKAFRHNTYILSIVHTVYGQSVMATYQTGTLPV